MTQAHVYACKECGNLYATQEDLDLHHDQRGHDEAVRLKPLFIARLDEIDKGLVFFKLLDESRNTTPKM
jgi:hypothetical protein